MEFLIYSSNKGDLAYVEWLAGRLIAMISVYRLLQNFPRLFVFQEPTILPDRINLRLCALQKPLIYYGLISLPLNRRILCLVIMPTA